MVAVQIPLFLLNDQIKKKNNHIEVTQTILRNRSDDESLCFWNWTWTQVPKQPY